MNRRPLIALCVLAVVGATAAEASNWRAKMLRDLAKTAVQFDAVLQSPASEPTPSWGSAVREKVDEKGLKEYEVVLSSCTQQLKYKDVAASGDFSKVVQSSLKVGAGVSFDVADITGGYSNTQLGGLDYHLSAKRIVDPESVDEYRKCCVLQPDQCQDQVISEWWKGQGAYYTLANSSAEAKIGIKNLKYSPQANVDWSRGWGVSMKWPGEGSGCAAFPAAGWQECSEFFAYRTQTLQVPTCQQYMADAPEREGFTLFVGVSDFFDSESMARNKAREDVIKQVASYCGTDAQGNFDSAKIEFGDRVYATVDAFACQDHEDAGGTVKYRGRNRVWMSAESLRACLDRKAIPAASPAPAPVAPTPAPTRQRGR